MSYGVQLGDKRVSLWSIASLACGLIGLVTGVFAIPSVVFGHIARRDLSKDPELAGSGLATAGLILGYIGVALMVIGLLTMGGLGLLTRIVFGVASM